MVYLAPDLEIGTNRTPCGSFAAHVQQSSVTSCSAPTATSAVPSASFVQSLDVQVNGSATWRSTIDSGRGGLSGVAWWTFIRAALAGGRMVSDVRLTGWTGAAAGALLGIGISDLGPTTKAGRRCLPRCTECALEGGAMPTTGETCLKSGTYEATCPRGHWQKAEMVSGHVFPPCGERAKDGSACGAPVDWTLRPTATH
jgi:hypothetical protein